MVAQEIVESYFAEAYACIEQGLYYDEINNWKGTLEMYERGIKLIEQALKSKKAKNCELYTQMSETLPSVKSRLKVLQREGPRAEQLAPTREMEQEQLTVEEKKEKEQAEEKAEEDKSEIRSHLDQVGEQEADLIFIIPDGVQLFTVENDVTAAPTYPTSLQILRFDPKETASLFSGDYDMVDQPSAFIQVGPWVYPLIAGRTPVLRNDYGAYVVSNPTPDHPDMMVAILLPSDLDAHIEREFKQVLSEYAYLKESEVGEALSSEEKQRLSHKIAQLIIRGGDKIAWGVQETAAKTASRYEANQAQKREGVAPTDKPMNINPAVKSSVMYMHKGSKVVAKCTRYLLDRIGDMGVAVGHKLAHGATSTFGNGKTGGLVSGSFLVTGGCLTSISTVWVSLEDASKTLCRSIANAHVDNVRVKYGEEASETTHNLLFGVGHTSLAAAQLWDLGPRSVATRMARKAGIQAVHGIGGTRKLTHPGDAGALPEKKAL